ncbi:MAG: hypothetical protein PHV20_04875 [Bacteroidales bacterium]|nr:hypothetical protein [Bacteroidales bacterium]
MKTTTSKLAFICLLSILPLFSFAQAVVQSENMTPDLLETLCKNQGIAVLEKHDSYLLVKTGGAYPISMYLDISSEKDYIMMNNSNDFVEGTDSIKAKNLVSDINSKTNFVKAGYIPEKSKIEFRYYFWIKDGFTEKSLFSALEMYRLTYIYAITLDSAGLIK